MNTVFDKWALTQRKLIARTATSDVFLVEQSEGTLAVLKLLSDIGKADEVHAPEILDWYDGCGSVKLIRANEDALLLEYAQGGELSELVLAGEDDKATRIVCCVVRQLHSVRAEQVPVGLPTLRVRFGDLFSEADKTQDPIVREAASIADTLLRTTQTETALHGDLHHHNIIRADRGWLAIDPKGLVGDPAYDVSNLFANPLGCEEFVTRPERAVMLLQICADELGYCKVRIARFAFVHNVIAAIWSGSIHNVNDVSLQFARNIRSCFNISG